MTHLILCQHGHVIPLRWPIDECWRQLLQLKSFQWKCLFLNWVRHKLPFVGRMKAWGTTIQNRDKRETEEQLKVCSTLAVCLWFRSIVAPNSERTPSWISAANVSVDLLRLYTDSLTLSLESFTYYEVSINITRRLCARPFPRRALTFTWRKRRIHKSMARDVCLPLLLVRSRDAH